MFEWQKETAHLHEKLWKAQKNLNNKYKIQKRFCIISEQHKLHVKTAYINIKKLTVHNSYHGTETKHQLNIVKWKCQDCNSFLIMSTLLNLFTTKHNRYVLNNANLVSSILHFYHLIKYSCQCRVHRSIFVYVGNYSYLNLGLQINI